MFFALVAKGASDGALLIAKRKPTDKEINEAKAACGGKQLFKGRCRGEEGKLVFELPTEPPAALANQLKTIIKRDAGLSMGVEVRMAAGSDAEEAPPAAAAPAASNEAAQFTVRLKALLPRMQQAEKTQPAQALAAKAKLGEVSAFLKAKNYAQASAALDPAIPGLILS